MQHHWHNFNYWLDHGIRKQDYLAVFILGLMSALAMPPVNAFLVLFFTFPLFYRVLNKSLTTKQAAVKTWLFHFGYFTAGFYWIAWALFVDIAHNWWVIPFAVFGLPALMSFYPALLIALWHRLAWRGTARLLLFVVMLGAGEWLRGVCFTGFPWNLWAYTWVAWLPVLQTVSLIGAYGLTLLTLLLAMAPTLWARRHEHLFARATLSIILGVFVVLTAWGAGRLHTPLKTAEHPYIARIVQPNIPETVKWNPQTRVLNEEKIWQLSSQTAELTPNIVIWPETALSLGETWDVRRLENNIQTLLPPGTFLAAGLLDVDLDDATHTRHYYNRIALYDHDGHRLATYDKSHLVPFGEFLPFQKYWPVTPVAFRDGAFTPGDGVTTIMTPNLPPFSPLICYEVLFPGATASKTQRPDFILNATNDAWYGYTSGPFQHLGIAQTRAVEEGLPLLRAANTGISAVIDPMGRIVAGAPLDSEDIITEPIPPHLPPTLFARCGNILFFLLLGVFAVLAWGMHNVQNKKLTHVA